MSNHPHPLGSTALSVGVFQIHCATQLGVVTFSMQILDNSFWVRVFCVGGGHRIWRDTVTINSLTKQKSTVQVSAIISHKNHKPFRKEGPVSYLRCFHIQNIRSVLWVVGGSSFTSGLTPPESAEQEKTKEPLSCVSVDRFYQVSRVEI